jgi:hypothetical protein
MNIQPIIDFFNHPFFIIVGGITTIVMIVGFLYVVFLVFRGALPVWYRLGMGLSTREIAIFGSSDAFGVIRDSLLDSGIFNDGNIVHITDKNIDKAKTKTIFLVDWGTFADRIDEVFIARKDNQTAIVIYASPGSIPQPRMADIANRTNTVVVNFRGRLVNDILTSLITTSYEKG